MTNRTKPMANDLGQADTQNVPDEELNREVDIPDVNPDEATSEQVKEVINKSKTLQAQRKHWQRKAIDPETGRTYAELYAEAKKGAQTSNPTPPPAEHSDDLTKTVKELKLSEEKRQFASQHNLNQQETDIVFAQAAGLKQDPSEVLKSDFIKIAFQANRARASAQSAIPSPSGRSPQVDGKTFAQMKPEDRKKHFAEHAAAFVKK